MGDWLTESIGEPHYPMEGKEGAVYNVFDFCDLCLHCNA